jgi:hypothetical protein
MTRTSPNHRSEYSNIMFETVHQLQSLQKIDKKLNFGRLPDMVVNLKGNIILVKKNLLAKIE